MSNTPIIGFDFRYNDIGYRVDVTKIKDNLFKLKVTDQKGIVNCFEAAPHSNVSGYKSIRSTAIYPFEKEAARELLIRLD